MVIGALALIMKVILWAVLTVLLIAIGIYVLHCATKSIMWGYYIVKNENEKQRETANGKK